MSVKQGLQHTKTSILLVDDEKETNEVWIRNLERRGYEATGETDPTRVAAVVRNKQFHVVLVDIHMPPYSGLQVLMDVAAYSPQSIVIAMSGRSEISDVLECLQHGAVDFIEKPFELSTLLQRIEVNAARPRFQQAPAQLREQLIRSLWDNIDHEVGAKRGLRLEQLMQHLFTSVPFFVDVLTRLRTDVEEIDLECINKGDETFWRECGGLFLAECKNWSPGQRTVGIQELDHFVGTLRRSALCKIGFFVSYSGFSPEFREAKGRALSQGQIVVPIDKEDLHRLVETQDRASIFQQLIRTAAH
jgi:CheY-like chemotaxis protein